MARRDEPVSVPTREVILGGTAMLRAFGRLLAGVKNAWEWWALFAGLGLLPALPVVLAFLHDWSWDVIALYAVGAVAFWVVLMVEAVPLWSVVTTLGRRLRQQLEVEIGTCCFSYVKISDAIEPIFFARIGISNPGRQTVENVRVYLTASGATADGKPINRIEDRLLRWVTSEPTEVYRIDPTPRGFHHHVDLLMCQGAQWSFILFSGAQRIDAKPYALEVSVLGTDVAPTMARIEVLPSDTVPALIAVR